MFENANCADRVNRGGGDLMNRLPPGYLFSTFGAGSEGTVTVPFTVPIKPVRLSRTPRRRIYSPGGRSNCLWQGKKLFITAANCSGLSAAFEVPPSAFMGSPRDE